MPKHLFFPSPLPTAPPPPSTSTAPPPTTYLYGWTYGAATVVAGALDAPSWADASTRVERVGAAFTEGASRLKVLGRVIRAGEGSILRGKRRLQVEPGLDVHLSPAGVPSPLSDTTTILYTPPSRANLQFFSLEPLQLDLNRFSDPAARDPKGDADVEGSLLGDKVRHSARLDFSRREDDAGTELARVVDWVSRPFWDAVAARRDSS